MRNEDPLAEVIREEIRAKDLGPPVLPGQMRWGATEHDLARAIRRHLESTPMVGVRYVHDNACPDCASQAHEAIEQLRACDLEAVYAVELYDTPESSEPPARGIQVRSGVQRCGATAMLITSAVEAWLE